MIITACSFHVLIEKWLNFLVSRFISIIFTLSTWYVTGKWCFKRVQYYFCCCWCWCKPASCGGSFVILFLCFPLFFLVFKTIFYIWSCLNSKILYFFLSSFIFTTLFTIFVNYGLHFTLIMSGLFRGKYNKYLNVRKKCQATIVKLTFSAFGTIVGSYFTILTE